MDLNKTNIKKILGIITFAILLYVGAQNLDVIWSFLSTGFKLLFPFILGAGIAFILNVPMRGLEHWLFRNKKSKFPLKMKRLIGLLLTLIIVSGIIFLVLVLVIPEIGRTIDLVGNKFPDFYTRLELQSTALLEKYPDIANYISRYEFNWKEIGTNIYNFMLSSGGTMLQSTFSVATSILGGLVNFFLGFIFAIYILVQKENLGQQARKLMYAYLPMQVGDKIISICSLSSRTFSKFLSGQCLEAVILGTIFFIAMSIFHLPYALMISVLIGFTALIPVFGAFIGCVVGAFLILIVDPVLALWFIVLFIVLQQLEGNFIYPHVVGGSVGLPSMWVLVAVTLGGSTLGVAGMLIFIPMFSVLYTLLREAMYKRIKMRKIPTYKYKA